MMNSEQYHLKLKLINKVIVKVLPAIIGTGMLVGAIALAALVGLGILSVPTPLVCLLQIILILSGIALAIRMYNYMVARSPELDLYLEGSRLRLFRKKTLLREYDLSRPHKLLVMTQEDITLGKQALTKVFVSQDHSEMDFDVEMSFGDAKKLSHLKVVITKEQAASLADDVRPVTWTGGMVAQDQSSQGVKFIRTLDDFAGNNSLLRFIDKLRRGEDKTLL